MHPNQKSAFTFFGFVIILIFWLLATTGCDNDDDIKQPKRTQINSDVEACFFHQHGTYDDGVAEWAMCTFIIRNEEEPKKFDIHMFQGYLKIYEDEGIDKPRVEMSKSYLNPYWTECTLYLPVGYFKNIQGEPGDEDTPDEQTFNLQDANDWMQHYNRR